MFSAGLIPICIQDGRPSLRPGTPGGSEDCLSRANRCADFQYFCIAKRLSKMSPTQYLCHRENGSVACRSPIVSAQALVKQAKGGSLAKNNLVEEMGEKSPCHFLPIILKARFSEWIGDYTRQLWSFGGKMQPHSPGSFDCQDWQERQFHHR